MAAPDCPQVTTVMEDLIDEIRGAAKSGEDAGPTSRKVAGRLAPFLGREDLLTPEQRAASDDDYTQHVVHVEGDGEFSVVSLVWLPGQDTPIHDHVSWCVPGVHEGRESEIHYRGMSREAGVLEAPGHRGRVDFLVEQEERTNRAGDVTALTPPGDIHRVWNPGPGKAISIHVYGADIRELGSSIRRCYPQPVRQSSDTEPQRAR